MGSSSELPASRSASAQRLALERPTELPPGWKGAAWGQRDFDGLGERSLVGRIDDGDAVGGGGAHAACTSWRRLAAVAEVPSSSMTHLKIDETKKESNHDSLPVKGLRTACSTVGNSIHRTMALAFAISNTIHEVNYIL